MNTTQGRFGNVLGLTLSGLLVLQGCGWSKTSGPVVPLGDRTKPEEIIKTRVSEFQRILDGCQKSLSDFKGRREGLSWALVGIGVVGAVLGGLGTVFLAASAANTTTAAALSSGAGVAAGAQPLLYAQGMAPEQVRAIHDQIASDVQKDLKKWSGIQLSGDLEEVRRRNEVIGELDGHCRFYRYGPEAGPEEPSKTTKTIPDAKPPNP